MILRITQYGEPVLRVKGEPVTCFDSDLEVFARDMIETMHAHNGVGLAAQQVNCALQICVVDLRAAYVSKERIDFEYTCDGKTPPLQIIMPLVIVNPRLKLIPGTKVVDEEGCLSFPNLQGSVERYRSICLEFQDLQGAPHVLDCNNFLARVIQHEFDHLQGVLYIDRMDKQDLTRLAPELKNLKRQARSKLRKAQKAFKSPQGTG